jgi:hypothetical protein
MTTKIRYLVGKSRDASDGLAENKGMNVVGTFISIDSFKVSGMTDDVILIRDTVSTEHISAITSNVESLATRVALNHGDHFRSKLVAVLQTTDMETCLKAKGDLELGG